MTDVDVVQAVLEDGDADGDGEAECATVQATFPSRDERLRLAMSMTSGAITPT